ncbi:MAG: glycosyltransferase family 39 protein [Lysobacteraceae bacterium]
MSINQAAQQLRWLRALLLLLAIKAVWLACDAIPRVFLHDSVSYMLAASSDWMPPDRSFTYPWLLRWLVMPLQSPYALIVVQSLAGVISAWLLWWLMRRRFGISETIALLVAAAFACDPAQVFYERMVMAEAFGSMALMMAFAATVEYVATTRLRWLVALEVFGLFAISLRLNQLPVVLVMGVVTPLLLWHGKADNRRVVVHLLVALLLLGGLHGSYRQYIAQHFDVQPAWNARSGFMELGLVAPLVKPEHLWAEGISPNVLSLLHYDLQDPALRGAQMWSAFGLGDMLGLWDDARGDALAGRIARRALRDDPFGLLRLGVRNLEEYFDPKQSIMRLHMDRASVRPYDAGSRELARTVLNTDIAGTEKVGSPARRWFTVGSSWLLFCWFALVPLAAGACSKLRKQGRLREGCVLLLYALGLASTQLLFSSIISYRYLHSMPALVLLALAVLATMSTTNPNQVPNVPDQDSD